MAGDVRTTGGGSRAITADPRAPDLVSVGALTARSACGWGEGPARARPDEGEACDSTPGSSSSSSVPQSTSSTEQEGLSGGGPGGGGRGELNWLEVGVMAGGRGYEVDGQRRGGAERPPLRQGTAATASPAELPSLDSLTVGQTFHPSQQTAKPAHPDVSRRSPACDGNRGTTRARSGAGAGGIPSLPLPSTPRVCRQREGPRLAPTHEARRLAS
jgi:hypothetical protein